jgi:uncharacterized protein
MYTLHCRSDAGEAVRFRYDPHTSELFDEAGQPVVGPKEPAAFKAARRISPADPGRKSRAVRTLKIQLGLRCNYSCSYCNQASEIGSASVTKTADADAFLRSLDDWLEGEPERVEFWGGEPFVYFAKLKRLVPALRRRLPGAEFLIVTNGSLIDEEIIRFVEEHDILLAVSHDGPGQALRGPDPFDDPERARRLRELWRRRGRKKRMSFNVVLTPANCDVEETHAWLAARVGDPDITLFTEGAVAAYDEHAAQAARFSDERYAVLERSIERVFAEGHFGRYASFEEKAKDLIDSLFTRRPSSALGQKCGMDREDELAVDLKGNAMTCQNTGAGGRHGIGSVADFDAIRLDTAWHWSQRECCNHCPVLQLCKGSCMYLEGELFAQSCENEYRYNRAILAGVIRFVTGLTLERIEGDIRRPKRRKTIPIAAIAA